jgi:Bacterial PH domain
VFGRDDPVQWFLAVVVASGLAGWALRDAIAPVRLAADPDGVTVVVGFAGRRRLAWSEIERVRIDRRDRLGVRSELLEVDVGDSLYLFSRYELGAEPEDVLASLLALRSARPSGTPPAR